MYHIYSSSIRAIVHVLLTVGALYVPVMFFCCVTSTVVNKKSFVRVIVCTSYRLYELSLIGVIVGKNLALVRVIVCTSNPFVRAIVGKC